MLSEFILLVVGLGLLILLLLTLIPVSTGSLAPRPNPAATYDEAVARFAAARRDEEAACNPAGVSLLLTHGRATPRAYVFVHGTTNSPRQFEELGSLLHARGHNVLIPRMPRHGLRSGRLSELRRLSAEDLRDYADEAVDLAGGLGDEVVAVGISGGGTVVAWMAQNRPQVAVALLLAPFLGVRGASPAASNLMGNFFSRTPSFALEDPLEPRRDWVYRGQATRALAQTLRLGRSVFRRAADVAPQAGCLLVLTTPHDAQVSNGATARLVGLWRARGSAVTHAEFDAALNIPHNSIDPSADPRKKRIVYERILALLGEAELS